jgi:hypothetical protein
MAIERSTDFGIRPLVLREKGSKLHEGRKKGKEHGRKFG